MKKTITKIPGNPTHIGPYSPGVIAEGRFLFVSGQGPWDPKADKFDRGSIADQTRLTLETVKRVVEAAGGRMEDAVSCRVFLQPLTQETFTAMNDVYRRYWGDEKPARTTIGCTLLNIDVEIDCVILMKQGA
ncbi:MAG: deaminase [Verrucomicrobia bacterium]|nr:deaminase [Verrucomicrobiota bacterium]